MRSTSICAIGFALLLAGCDSDQSASTTGNGDTSTSEATVPAKFQEVKDELEGTALVYGLPSERYDAKLVFSCEHQHVDVMYTFQGVGEWPDPALNMDMKTRIDDGTVEVVRFTTVPGTKGMAPGQNTQEQNIAYLRSLKGRHKLVVQASMPGTTNSDPASVFDIEGIEIPIDRVLRFCKVE